MIDLKPLSLAVESFEEILKQPMNEFIRDGAIQRFEYTFELSWKSLQRLLKLRGVEAASPAQVIRASFGEGLIQNPDRWLGFLKSRNLTVHTYNQKVAEEVFKDAKDFLRYSKDLLKALEVHVQSLK